MSARLRKLFGRSFAFRIFVGFASACLVLSIIGVLAVRQFEYVVAIDEGARKFAHRIADPWLTDFLRAITRLGSTLVLTIVGTVATITLLIMRRHRVVVLFLLAMAGQIILHHGFKALVTRQRPEPLLGYVVGDSYSFPSGHALASLSVYGILAWLVTRRITLIPIRAAIWIFTSILVLLIGFSRIYFGVHNATDVIAGYLAAFIWIVAVASGDRPKHNN